MNEQTRSKLIPSRRSLSTGIQKESANRYLNNSLGGELSTSQKSMGSHLYLWHFTFLALVLPSRGFDHPEEETE